MMFSNNPINDPMSNSNYLIGAIVGVLVVILVAVVICHTIAIVALLKRRNNKKTKEGKPLSNESPDTLPLDNPVYSEGISRFFITSLVFI